MLAQGSMAVATAILTSKAARTAETSASLQETPNIEYGLWLGSTGTIFRIAHTCRLLCGLSSYYEHYALYYPTDNTE